MPKNIKISTKSAKKGFAAHKKSAVNFSDSLATRYQLVSFFSDQ